MGWGIRRRLATLLGRDATQRDDGPDAAPASPDEGAVEPTVEPLVREASRGEDRADGSPGSRSGVGLYECPDCARTYVSEGLDSCPQCGGEVDSIANERDLGMA